MGRSTNQKANFVCHYSVTRILFFTSAKDKLNKQSKLNVKTEFSYSGKTEWILFERTKEHLTRPDTCDQRTPW